MCGSDAVIKIVEELEFLEAEKRRMRERGPHFRIVLRCSEPFVPCDGHEEISALYLVHARNSVQLRLGETLSILFNYLARHNRFAQTAKQIARGTHPRDIRVRSRISADLSGRSSGIPARYVRVYIDRIREALGAALTEAGLDSRPESVLLSEKTVLNEVGYRLRATVEWHHITS